MLKTRRIIADKSLSHLCENRRRGRRIRTKAAIDYRSGSQHYQNTSVIECTTCGARMVVAGKLTVNQSLELLVTTPNFSLSGNGRVAWAKPLSSGHTVVGVQFLSIGHALGATA